MQIFCVAHIWDNLIKCALDVICYTCALYLSTIQSPNWKSCLKFFSASYKGFQGLGGGDLRASGKPFPLLKTSGNVKS